jgi:hypothetical protein
LKPRAAACRCARSTIGIAPFLYFGPAIRYRELSKKVEALHHILRRKVEVSHNAMASVYKSLSKTNGSKEEDAPANGVKRNKQRVLILSSRGITYRYGHRCENLNTVG